MSEDDLIHFRIVDIKQETPAAKSYYLRALNRNQLVFLPGQFLTFIINTGKHEIRRSYSIANLPGEPTKITVKKVENGLVSRFILQHWDTEDIIYSLPPAGRFTLEPLTQKKRDIFCFAAGSGIVPILPQVRFLLEKESDSIIHLVYSNKNEEDALFLDEIENLASSHSKLNLINLFSDPVKRHKERGRLSNLSAETLIKDNLHFQKEDSVFLICGPFAYMRMLIFTLGLLGFSKEKVKRENFLPEIMRAGQAVHKELPDRRIVIKTRQITSSVLVKSGNSILDAGLELGLNLPFSCKGGVCGICAAKCYGGKVHMSINEVLSDTDIAEGWVLTCTGFPEDPDLIVDFGENTF